MKANQNKKMQLQRLKEICNDKNVNFDFLETLLDSVRTKKLISKRNYHHQTIIDVIEKAVK